MFFCVYTYNMSSIQGIHVSKSRADNICYLIPVGANRTEDRNWEKFFDNWDGKTAEQQQDETLFETHVLDGKLRDVSFLPQRVRNECTNGYQWMTLTPTDDQGIVIICININRTCSLE